MNKKIIDFNPSRLPLKPKKNKFCQHRYVWVVEKTRMLTCRDCEADIEPFDFVLEWANSGAILNNNRKWLLNEKKRLQARVVELKREERNTKARIRNAKKIHQEKTT